MRQPFADRCRGVGARGKAAVDLRVLAGHEEAPGLVQHPVLSQPKRVFCDQVILDPQIEHGRATQARQIVAGFRRDPYVQDALGHGLDVVLRKVLVRLQKVRIVAGDDDANRTYQRARRPVLFVDGPDGGPDEAPELDRDVLVPRQSLVREQQRAAQHVSVERAGGEAHLGGTAPGPQTGQACSEQVLACGLLALEVQGRALAVEPRYRPDPVPQLVPTQQAQPLVDLGVEDGLRHAQGQDRFVEGLGGHVVVAALQDQAGADLPRGSGTLIQKLRRRLQDRAFGSGTHEVHVRATQVVAQTYPEVRRLPGRAVGAVDPDPVQAIVLDDALGHGRGFSRYFRVRVLS